MINEIDNESNESDQQLDIGTSQTKKPSNRARFQHKGLILSSEFSGGNLKAALFQQEFRMQGKMALVVEFWGNSDAQSDPLDKSWFYFSVSGIAEFAKRGYEQIIFRFKNANNYRKFLREKRFKPYVAVKELSENYLEQWQTLYVSKMNILQSQIIEAEFAYAVKPNVNQVFFAENLPYTLANFERMHNEVEGYLNAQKKLQAFYHREIIARSVDDHNIYMCTITSKRNIMNFQQREPQIFVNANSTRPFLLKNRPEIVITARVHPSQTSSSFCVEGIIESLIKNPQFGLLLQFFIFRIVPMVNPDGIENGHYRLDNYLQNLNRYYGHSDQVKTPSIFAIQNLLTSLRQKSKLCVFLDIHGHNSPKPAFIFGNFNLNLYQSLENKTFVKIMEVLSQGSFNSQGCEFSKRNMTVKQKYDEHSKEASARVFAYRGNSQQENNQNQNKNYFFVEHSYTLQIHPYMVADQGFRKSLVHKLSKEGSGSNKNLLKVNQISKKPVITPALELLCGSEIIQQYKRIGQIFLVSILEMIGANSCLKLPESEDCLAIRKRNFKQLTKLLQFYDRSKRMKTKQINKQLFERYYQRWNLIEAYKQYTSVESESESLRVKLKSCPIHQYYEQNVLKKQKQKAEQLNMKKLKIKSRQKNISNRHQNQDIDQELQEREKQKEKQERSTIIQKVHGSRKTGNEDLKLKVLAAKQFEMLQRIDPRDSNKNSINSNFSQCKKPMNAQATQIELLERKIRKLMFRHRTEVQIPESTEKLYCQSSVQCIERKRQQDQGINARKVTINPKRTTKKNSNSNKLQPLQKVKKDKIIYLKTEEIKNQIEFNDQNFANDQTSFNKRCSKLEGLQPRIQQFVRKLSQNRQDLNTIQHEKEQEITKIQSNGICLNQRKKATRASHQHLKQSYKNTQMNEACQEQITMYYNRVLATEARSQLKSNQDEQGENVALMKTRLTSYHRSVKSKLQNVEVQPALSADQQIHHIVKSFRVLAEGTSLKPEDFIQKARKLLPESKRKYKTLDEPYLPVITEFDPFGGRKSKAKAPEILCERQR